MLTIEKLREFGADVDEGLNRCMKMEAFYIQLVGTALADDHFEKLEKALADSDLDQAFECAHALKGVYANLALTPLFKPVSEMTELLRSRTEMDYTPLLQQAKAEKERLAQLAE